MGTRGEGGIILRERPEMQVAELEEFRRRFGEEMLYFLFQDEAVKPLEIIHSQLEKSFDNYSALTGAINEVRVGKPPIDTASKEDFERELYDWLDMDKIYALNDRDDGLNAGRTRDKAPSFILLAMPNIRMSAKELAKLQFQVPAVRAHIDPHDLERHEDFSSEIEFSFKQISSFSPKQLSGTDPGNGMAMHFAFIETGMPHFELPNGRGIESKQAEHKSLTTPSVYETMAYWQNIFDYQEFPRQDDTLVFSHELKRADDGQVWTVGAVLMSSRYSPYRKPHLTAYARLQPTRLLVR